ncbi:neural Wiskott-Aldrich syndrome protein-like isoform X2 [Melanotaenia boesemani]|uniref:neural Wiskott-Aldrich syndrome protein-like isoform X2 n=1 Tax=Melanotaenia boesemani TaxID=1250792 RepID=UPI001C04D545|nr:neural Wiskott-Aldrich syndrome protein-like isoform X2 [Melanotaenia boesemani]
MRPSGSFEPSGPPTPPPDGLLLGPGGRATGACHRRCLPPPPPPPQSPEPTCGDPNCMERHIIQKRENETLRSEKRQLVEEINGLRAKVQMLERRLRRYRASRPSRRRAQYEEEEAGPSHRVPLPEPAQQEDQPAQMHQMAVKRDKSDKLPPHEVIKACLNRARQRIPELLGQGAIKEFKHLHAPGLAGDGAPG